MATITFGSHEQAPRVKSFLYMGLRGNTARIEYENGKIRYSAVLFGRHGLAAEAETREDAVYRVAQKFARYLESEATNDLYDSEWEREYPSGKVVV